MEGLRSDVDGTLRNGCTRTNDQGQVFFLHLLGLDDLIQKCELAWKWIKREGINVWETARNLDFEFRSHREAGQESETGQPDRFIIWSRRSMQNRRTDSEEKKAFCWQPEELDTNEGQGAWRSWLGTKAGNDDRKHKRPGFGDTSNKHGE